MRKQRKLLSLTLAFTVCAGVFIFPMTAYATEETTADVTAVAVETDLDSADVEPITDEEAVSTEGADPAAETESGIPSYDGSGHLTPDGTATVIDNVFIEGNGLEFFTFTTEANNVFYLIIDRMRQQNNVYFLNAVTESDLLALADKNGTALTASTSGIPSTPGGTTSADPTGEPETPEEPSAEKGGISGGSLIFILIGVAAVGGAGYYFKIVRPRQQRVADDDGSGYGDEDDYDDYGDYDEVYSAGEDDGAADTETEE